ncbi:hypothetical protein GT348_09035 (plasmid) [Aristophania vespae]|uniref:Uncharacterized protein n=1 Tax=Aristophania vespae TaxID=2697033 RepID=A0A6P1NNR1_9PROT|nr:hypothetical protein [Aristophania vespae]QHI96491.1 hypothetical protein GT348_09035 [Aristophania vespae]
MREEDIMIEVAVPKAGLKNNQTSESKPGASNKVTSSSKKFSSLLTENEAKTSTTNSVSKKGSKNQSKPKQDTNPSSEQSSSDNTFAQANDRPANQKTSSDTNIPLKTKDKSELVTDEPKDKKQSNHSDQSENIIYPYLDINPINYELSSPDKSIGTQFIIDNNRKSDKDTNFIEFDSSHIESDNDETLSLQKDVEAYSLSEISADTHTNPNSQTELSSLPQVKQNGITTISSINGSDNPDSTVILSKISSITHKIAKQQEDNSESGNDTASEDFSKLSVNNNDYKNRLNTINNVLSNNDYAQNDDKPEEDNHVLQLDTKQTVATSEFSSELKNQHDNNAEDHRAKSDAISSQNENTSSSSTLSSITSNSNASVNLSTKPEHNKTATHLTELSQFDDSEMMGLTSLTNSKVTNPSVPSTLNMTVTTTDKTSVHVQMTRLENGISAVSFQGTDEATTNVLKKTRHDLLNHLDTAGIQTTTVKINVLPTDTSNTSGEKGHGSSGNGTAFSGNSEHQNGQNSHNSRQQSEDRIELGPVNVQVSEEKRLELEQNSINSTYTSISNPISRSINISV